MAGLKFQFDADVRKLRQTREELEKLKSILKSTSDKSPLFDGLEKEFGKLHKQYTQLVDKVIKAQHALNEALKAEQVTKETKKITEQTENATKTFTKYADSLEEVKRQSKELTKEFLSMSQAQRVSPAGQGTASQIATLNGQIKIEADALRSLQKEYVNTQKVQQLQEGSIKSLRAQLSSLTASYDNLGRTERNGAFGKEMLGNIQLVTKELSEAEQASMRFQRNVGNYASGFNGLNMSLQQVARELPSLAIGANTFFLAISNNIPILADNIKQARTEYKKLISEGKNATPVWKQLVSSLFSWQTALVAGVTVLSLYGKEIINWAGSLFTAKKALSETYQSLEEYQKKVGEASGNTIATLERLSDGWKRLGNDVSAQKKYIIENKDAIDSMGASVTNATEAERIFNTNKDAFILGILQRAKAAAAMELAADEYKKAIERMMEADAMPDKKTYKHYSGTLFNGQWETRSYDNPDKIKAKKEAEDLIKSGSDLVQKYVQFSDKEAEILKGIGIKTTQTMVDGSVEAIEAAISLKQQALKKVTDPKEYKRIESEIKAEQAKLRAITGAQEKVQAKNYIDSYQQSKEIEQASKSIKETIIKSDLSIQQQQIDLMDDGNEKQLAQIRLNYDKRYQEIIKEEDELLRKLQDEERKRWEEDNPKFKEKNLQFTPTITSLTPEQKAQFEKEYSLAYQKQEKDTQSLLDKLLEKYQDFNKRREVIHKQGNDDIAELNAQRTTENSSEIDRAIEEAKRKIKEGIQSINNEEAAKSAEDSPFIKMLFGDISSMSFGALQTLMSQAKQLREYLNGKGTSEGITFIDPEQLKAIEKSPAELEKLKKALDKLLNPGNDQGENKWVKIFAGFKKGFADLKGAKGFTEISGAIGGITSAASEASVELANMFEEMGQTEVSDAVSGVGQLMSSISNIGQGFAKGGIVGGIAAAVGEAANFIGKAFAASARHQAALKEIMKETISQQREYNLLLLEQNLLYEKGATIFGSDAYGKAKNAITVMKDAVVELNEEIKGSGKYEGGYFKKGILSVDMMTKSQRDYYNSVAGLANIEIKTGHKKTGLFGWGKGKDIYSSVLDVYPELIDKNGEFNAELAKTIINTRTMSEEDKAALQGAIDYSEKAKEAYKVMNDYLTDIFGSLGSAMSDALVDAFVNGTDAAQSFTDSVSNMLETLAKQMIYSVTLAPIIEKAQGQMMDVMKDTSLSDEQKFQKWTGILGNMTDEAIGAQEKGDKLLEKFKKDAADKGFDIFSPKESKEAINSFVSSMESAFNSLDVKAKDVSDNIYDYFRQSMIKSLYDKEYKAKMEEIYKEFEELSSDGLTESDMDQLGAKIDEYVNDMTKGVSAAVKPLSDRLKSSQDMKSFVDSVKNAMTSIESTAEDVTDNIFEYIRKQMADKMFADTFQPQIEAFYKKVQAAMSDNSVTDEERNLLRDEADKLSKDIISAKDLLSDTLGVTASNIKKEADKEFKSFSDSILNSLYTADVTAQTIAQNISETMKKELIQAMYVEQYEPRMREIWDKWKEYSKDGLVTDEERANIKNDINNLSKEASDAAKEVGNAWVDAGEDVEKSIKSFSDSIKSVLYNAEATAEDVANNIYRFMRNALVDSMFAQQLQPQIEEWYKQYTEFMADGSISTMERGTLDEMLKEIQRAGVEITDAANRLFPTLDTGAQKRAEEAEKESQRLIDEEKEKWESFSDDVLGSLYDIEATSADISNNMGEYMRKALLKAMYVNNFKPQMEKWYKEWQKAMGDDTLTSEEKQNLDAMKSTIVDGMKKEMDAINQMFNSMYSQTATSKGFTGMSQDTGEELNGRFTALNITGEQIKNQSVITNDWLSKIHEKLEVPKMEMIRTPMMPNIADHSRNLIASSYQPQISVVFPDGKLDALASRLDGLTGIVDEMRTHQVEKYLDFKDVVRSTSILAKNSPKMLAAAEETKRNTASLSSR